MTKITQRLEFIDVARALAAFLVVIVHTRQHFPPQSTTLGMLADMGQLGVQLFFVASAFTIFASLERSGLQAVALRNFFISRFFRIAPLYYFGIVLYILIRVVLANRLHLSAENSASYTWPNIGANVALVHGLVPPANNSIVPGGWSIGTEWLFYCLSPLLFWSRQRVGSIALVAVACIIAMGVILRFTQGNLDLENNSFLYYSLINQLPVFACGMVLYCNREWFLSRSVTVCALSAVIASGAMFGAWSASSFPLKFTIVPLLAGFSAISICMLLSKVPKFPGFLTTFGKNSYSVYILHFFVVFSMKKVMLLAKVDLPFPLALLLVVVVVYWASGITYRYIEKPCIDYSKKLVKRPVPGDDLARVSG